MNHHNPISKLYFEYHSKLYEQNYPAVGSDRQRISMYLAIREVFPASITDVKGMHINCFRQFVDAHAKISDEAKPTEIVRSIMKAYEYVKNMQYARDLRMNDYVAKHLRITVVNDSIQHPTSDDIPIFTTVEIEFERIFESTSDDFTLALMPVGCYPIFLKGQVQRLFSDIQHNTDLDGRFNYRLSVDASSCSSSINYDFKRGPCVVRSIVFYKGYSHEFLIYFYTSDSVSRLADDAIRSIVADKVGTGIDVSFDNICSD